MSIQGGKGHGTIIVGSGAQGNGRAYVISTDAAESYNSQTELDIVNATNSSVSAGQIVELDSVNSIVEATSFGTRGTGSVDDGGTKVTVTDPGDTGLSGTVSIDFSHGENEGWGGSRSVKFANVDGKAAYLGSE